MKDKIILDGVEYELRKVEGPPEEKVEKMVGRTYIKEYLGVSNATLTRNPWNFPPPNFGKGLKKRERPYKESEVIEWLSKPENMRKKIYKETI